MTEDQVPAFYTELGAVLEKYNVGMMAGLWMASDSDVMGCIEAYPVGDTRLRAVGMYVCHSLKQWKDSIHRDPNEKEYYTVIKIKKHE
jgi:hypothetical protein